MRLVTPAEILDAHPEVSVLTIDFFDTLVTRSVAQPTHVFAVMEERLVAEEGDRWHGFALRRVLAERAARAEMSAVNEHADITLADITRNLARDLDLGLHERRRLEDMERATEIELTEPVGWGRALFSEAVGRGLRVLVVSDNYMPSTHLVTVAHKAGIRLDPEDVIVSCEHSAMKHDGSIWPVVLGIAGVPASQILHAGDLEDADGSLPARHGILTHVDPTMRAFHREPLNASPAVLPLSRIEASRPATGKEVHPVLGLASGAVALIVAGQVLDVMRRSSETPVAGIHFTARDGHLANLVFERVRRADPGLPPHSYTEVSRSIMWRATLRSVDETSVARFVGDDEDLTPARLGGRLGIALDTDIPDDAHLDSAAARELIVANAATVEEACSGLRSRLVAYLRGQGLMAPGHHLLVDLGWSGSVVADLARLVAEEEVNQATFEGRLTALYWDASTNRRSINLHGIAVDEFCSTDDNVRLLGAVRFFESLLTAPHASVSDYSDGLAVHAGGTGVSELGGIEWDAYEEAVVDAATAMVLGRHPHVRPDDIDRDVMWATMMQVACTPTRAELAALGAMRHETAIDHAGPGNPLVAAAPDGFVSEDSQSLYDTLMRGHWVQGTLAVWWEDERTRWVADEIRRHMLPVAPQWVRT